jgi:hypothetical protein
MPNIIQERIFHRDNLNSKKFLDGIKNKKNVLIMIDEIQIAAKEKQTMCKIFNKVGFYDRDYLLKNDIKIVEFTATPDGTIYDLMKWRDNAIKIKMLPGLGYISCFDFLDQGRVRQFKNLWSVKENILEIKKILDKQEKPLYHIIRTPKSDDGNSVIQNFKNVLGEDIIIKKYDRESDISDINSLLSIEPLTNIFIFIKEKLRCAKTLNKTYLGIMYERFRSKPDDTVIIQGLIGRGTGYDDNGLSYYFTNIESIEKYRILWNSNFEDKSVKWKSKTTKQISGILTSKGTYNNPSLIKGMNVQDNIIDPFNIKIFNSFDEAKEYLKTILPTSRPKRLYDKNKTEDGFYMNTLREKTEVMSLDYIIKNKKCGINKKSKYRIHNCYEDITDNLTLKFVVVFKNDF